MSNNIPYDYKPIPSFPGYYLNESGQIVKVYKNGSKHVLAVNDHFEVTLFKDGKRYCRSLTKIFVKLAMNQDSVRTKKVSALHVRNGSHKWMSFNSLKEASEATGVPVSYISKVINGDGRYSTCGWAFRTEVPHV